VLFVVSNFGFTTEGFTTEGFTTEGSATQVSAVKVLQFRSDIEFELFLNLDQTH
jgi:hypothetical protein